MKDPAKAYEETCRIGVVESSILLCGWLEFDLLNEPFDVFIEVSTLQPLDLSSMSHASSYPTIQADTNLDSVHR